MSKNKLLKAFTGAYAIYLGIAGAQVVLDTIKGEKPHDNAIELIKKGLDARGNPVAIPMRGLVVATLPATFIGQHVGESFTPSSK